MVGTRGTEGWEVLANLSRDRGQESPQVAAKLPEETVDQRARLPPSGGIRQNRPPLSACWVPGDVLFDSYNSAEGGADKGPETQDEALCSKPQWGRV